MTAPVAQGRQLPRYEDLTWDQHLGRHCVWCNGLITVGGREVGRVGTRHGAHLFDVPVYAGPCCLPKVEAITMKPCAYCGDPIKGAAKPVGDDAGSGAHPTAYWHADPAECGPRQAPLPGPDEPTPLQLHLARTGLSLRP